MREFPYSTPDFRRQTPDGQKAMANSLPQYDVSIRKVWETLFRLPLPLQRESSLFLIVSVLDVLMTCMLLGDLTGITGQTIFYESNPVARYFFENWHLRGIVYFKFGMVAIVEVIAHLIALKNVATARRLLEFGTLIVSVVVIYSLYLLVSHR
jgi:Domain of unknown function (DUF5658)